MHSYAHKDRHTYIYYNLKLYMTVRVSKKKQKQNKLLAKTDKRWMIDDGWWMQSRPL